MTLLHFNKRDSPFKPLKKIKMDFRLQEEVGSSILGKQQLRKFKPQRVDDKKGMVFTIEKGK